MYPLLVKEYIRIYKLKLLHKMGYRTHFTQQSKSFYNSKCRLLFFLKLQNHTPHECTNPLYKFEENRRTEFFNILLQIFISILSYILNNGFHTATLN